MSVRTPTCGGGAARLDRDSRTGQGQTAMTVTRFEAGTYVVRVDERGAKAGAGKWEASMAVAAYYGPRAGGVRFAPGINGCGMAMAIMMMIMIMIMIIVMIVIVMRIMIIVVIVVMMMTMAMIMTMIMMMMRIVMIIVII